jgi:hypothetical protein
MERVDINSSPLIPKQNSDLCGAPNRRCTFLTIV